jgi:hypothetical protein
MKLDLLRLALLDVLRVVDLNVVNGTSRLFGSNYFPWIVSAVVTSVSGLVRAGLELG